MYCGIDVAKNKSNVCILDKDKNVVKEFQIVHNREGFEELARNLMPDTKIAMEVTGNYSKIVYNFLKDKYDVCYVDGMQMTNIAQYHSPTIKNDKIDAKLLAKALTFPDLIKVNPVKVNELKDLSKLYQRVTRQLTIHKSMFKDQVNIIFPELETMMSNNNNMGLANMLSRFPTPKDILNATDEAIRRAMIKNMTKGKGKFTIEYVQKVKDLARVSVGDPEYPTSCFKYTIKTMLHYKALKQEIKKSLEAALRLTPYYNLLYSFGLNIASVATIVGEIADVRRFPNHKKFSSYCGFGICEKRSGTSVNKSTHISKRGNTLLRHTFYTLTLVHLSYKTGISETFKKMKEKGKHPKKALVACARKLAVKTYYDMLKCHNEENRPLNENSANNTSNVLSPTMIKPKVIR